MADRRISELTAAAALDGTEEFPANQASATVKVTLDEMLTYIGANIGGGGGGSGTFSLTDSVLVDPEFTLTDSVL
jgi:hypothetical protein